MDTETGGYSLSDEDVRLLAGLPRPFLHWYGEAARDLQWRRDRDPYRVWLSEIMLQQTRVEAVRGHFLRFIQVLPNIQALAEASQETVFKLWEGLGYYRRARNLHSAAQRIMREREGIFPSAYQEILTLPGVGEYTAGAIASICFDAHKPAVDGNVLRLMARMLDSEAPIDSSVFRRQVTAALEGVLGSYVEPGAAGVFNQSLIEAGAVVCLPKGALRCGACPAVRFCKGVASGRAEALPVRRVKKPRRIEEWTVLILWHGGGGYNLAGDSTGGMPAAPGAGASEARLALRRRGEHGLLSGMWELPNTQGWLSPHEALLFAASLGAAPVAIEQVLDREHIFTHVLWRMRGYVIRCAPIKKQAGSQPAGIDHALQWANAAQREAAYPLPSAFRQFLTPNL